MGLRLRPFAVAVLLLGLAAVGAADPGSRSAPISLSPTEAVRLGQQYSAPNRAAASRVSAAGARLQGARAVESPVLLDAARDFTCRERPDAAPDRAHPRGDAGGERLLPPHRHRAG